MILNFCLLMIKKLSFFVFGKLLAATTFGKGGNFFVTARSRALALRVPSETCVWTENLGQGVSQPMGRLMGA